VKPKKLTHIEQIQQKCHWEHEAVKQQNGHKYDQTKWGICISQLRSLSFIAIVTLASSATEQVNKRTWRLMFTHVVTCVERCHSHTTPLQGKGKR